MTGARELLVRTLWEGLVYSLSDMMTALDSRLWMKMSAYKRSWCSGELM